MTETTITETITALTTTAITVVVLSVVAGILNAEMLGSIAIVAIGVGLAAACGFAVMTLRDELTMRIEETR